MVVGMRRPPQVCARGGWYVEAGTGVWTVRRYRRREETGEVACKRARRRGMVWLSAGGIGVLARDSLQCGSVSFEKKSHGFCNVEKVARDCS